MAWLHLTSCAPWSEDTSLPTEPPSSFSASGSAELPARWWRAFGDAELDRLVEEALRSNFDLATAWERLREAQAIADRESAERFPEIDAFAEAGVQRPERADSERLRLGLSAQYEVDLWGRLQSRSEAERYRAEASRADYHTAALSLSAEVTRTWYQLVEERRQIELVRDQIQTNEEVLELLETRLGTGQVRSVDILRQRQLLESTWEQKTLSEARVRVLEHQLAVLLGRAPQRGVDAARDRLPALPPLPAAGVPGELVRRRPDLRRAHRELLAADRDLAAAISNRFPRLTISASVATAEGGATSLFQDWILSLAGNLLAPLFDGGARAAEVERQRAVVQQRLHQYGQVALNAFREVEDALAQEEKQRERIQHLEEQLRLANKSYEQLQVEYFNGVGNYIDVLTALADQQQLRRDLLAAERELLEFRVALYRGLAGSFETDREASS